MLLPCRFVLTLYVLCSICLVMGNSEKGFNVCPQSGLRLNDNVIQDGKYAKPKERLVSKCIYRNTPIAENPFTAVVKKSLISTARSCMVHVNATESDLQYLRNDPPFPEKAACIIKCLLEKIGIVKNNKYSKIGFMTAVSPLVFANKKKLEHMKIVSENCEKEINHQETYPCDLGNEITTCIFKYAPELHLKA